MALIRERNAADIKALHGKLHEALRERTAHVFVQSLRIGLRETGNRIRLLCLETYALCFNLHFLTARSIMIFSDCSFEVFQIVLER